MTQLKVLGAAAALLASAFATSAMAQQTIGTPARCSGASCQTMAPRSSGTTYHHRTYRRGRDWQNSYNRYDPGPAGIAAGVVGGAVGTAAAIATAPFGGPEYGYTPMGGDEYARRNGFVCTPGTWFRGSDGRQHPCQ
ncbi:hypothetical protein AS156_12435 [Bradyrhizobium macuxiense]|uniref:Lectin-like protein BA14k n=1 Tax=Bradyrhizobium macuxiense TaxID=1755647 RepID=A0A109JM62_9BRAD|nr:hypothetical protein [Bradyrhizobium macuxiense]KWV51388.1 hypothetical protein AS156_12435 [Bradyrhizobium macuxiense]